MSAVITFSKCFLCGKRCGESDRNTDGTYAHERCLRQHTQLLLMKERYDRR